MSNELLGHLVDKHAFTMRTFVELGPQHVPFDSLTGDTRVEARLQAAVARGETVAIVADSGAGKSSLMSYAFGPLALNVAPIYLPVHAMEREATRPERVADALMATLQLHGRETGSLDDIEMPFGGTQQVSDSSKRSAAAGLTVGWLHGELGRDVVRQVAFDRPVPPEAKREALRLAFERIGAADLQPVVLFDDTDRWLGNTDSATVEGFFGETMRSLAELPTAVVVAVHRTYVPDTRTREERFEFIQTPIEVPRLTESRALAAILERRIADAAEAPFANTSIGDAFDDDAVAAVMDAYEESYSVRRVLSLCHLAATEAFDADGQRITTEDVKAARAGF